ncbi:MAG: ATP-binding protein [Planctomycetes bacterium]|nr:ATP-binding protein [Planctomycetota bacterium]
MTLDFQLQRFQEHKAKGLAAHRSGDAREARFHLLKAAEYLYEMARRSEGRIRAQRAASARKLVELARSAPQAAERPVARASVGLGGPPATHPSPGAARAARDGGEDEATEFVPVERPSVRFDDIAGLDDVRREVELKMILPLTHPERAERFGIRRGGGVLLYGPPGTGKTLIARAIAGEVDAAFFTVKPSEVLSKWVGEAERNVERLFATARAQPRSVVFIDEVEALVPARRANQSTVMARLVPQILAELEGFSTPAGSHPLLFIGATNEPWALDPAVLRPGRFDARIYVGLPDATARRRIFELCLKGRPLASDVDLDALVQRTGGYSGADLRATCERAAQRAFLEAVQVDCDMPIDRKDLEAALDAVRPSVRPAELERFQAFARGEAGR